jgi:molybdenum cofactor cytidylyltransferase
MNDEANKMSELELTEPVVILCGGKSTRMGTAKGLVPFAGKTWLEAQLDSLKALGAQEVLLVLGYRSEEYIEALPWLKRPDKASLGLRLNVMVNPAPQQGPFSSIVTAANSIFPKRVPGAWILPIDVPCPERSVWAQLAKGRTSYQATVPIYRDRGGHPAWLSRDFLAQLFEVPWDSDEARLDLQMRRLPAGQLRRLPVDDPRVTQNLNRPKEFELFRETFFPGLGLSPISV